jgi:hypothetical protein
MLEEMIANNRLDEVLEIFKEYANDTKNSRLLNSSILISANLNSLRSERLLKTDSQYNMQLAQIRQAMLSTITTHEIKIEEPIVVTPQQNQEMNNEISMPIHEVQDFISKNKTKPNLLEKAKGLLKKFRKYEDEKLENLTNNYDPGNEKGSELIDEWINWRKELIENAQQKKQDQIKKLRKLVLKGKLAEACDIIAIIETSEPWKLKAQNLRSDILDDFTKELIHESVEGYLNRM